MLQQAAAGFPPPLPGFPGEYKDMSAMLETHIDQDQACRHLPSVVFRAPLP